MDSLRGWLWWDSTLIDIKSPASDARHPVHRGNEQPVCESFERLIFPKPRISTLGWRVAFHFYPSNTSWSFWTSQKGSRQISLSQTVLSAIFKVDFVVLYKMSCCGCGGGKYCLGMKHKTRWIALQSVKLNRELEQKQVDSKGSEKRKVTLEKHQVWKCFGLY